MSNQYTLLENWEPWSIEEEDIIRMFYDGMTWEDLAKLLNAKFHNGRLVRNWSSVATRANKNLELKKSFNRGCCSKGCNDRNTTTVSIGTESLVTGNGLTGILYVKVDDEVIGSTHNGRTPAKHNNPNWKRKDYIVWESAGHEAPDPKHEVLIHLDRDPYNCDLDNLYLVPRKINFMLSKNHWQTTDPTLTLTAIKWCELFYARKGGTKCR